MMPRLRSAMPHLLAYALLICAFWAAASSFAVVRVAGGSMVPALIPGDVVVVAKHQRPVEGSIVLMSPGETLVLHRVTSVAGDGSVRTRGDANPIADFTATPASAVRGVVTLVVPLGGVLARWRQSETYATLPAQTHSTRR